MALSALLLLGNLFKELRPLLVENKAPISIVLEFIFQVIPFSLMFSIPGISTLFWCTVVWPRTTNSPPCACPA